jgi:ParB-like chromosome segregation protein Spo0J
MKQFKLEYLDPRTLIPYASNPKKHPDSQISKLSGVIKEFDFDVPIVIDEENIILKGHCRLQSALQLGLKTVPVIKREGLTSTQKKAIRINDNRVGESAWDEELLAIEIEALGDDFDLMKLGFDENELKSLINEAVEGVETYFQEEVEERPVFQPSLPSYEQTKPEGRYIPITEEAIEDERAGFKDEWVKKIASSPARRVLCPHCGEEFSIST